MTLQSSINDREKNKFRDAGNNLSKVAVSMEGDSGLLEGVQYDDIQASYPSNTIENYAYYLNSILQATIEVTYQDIKKKIISRVRKI